MFYVGNQGGFDRLVRGVLREITQECPRAQYAVVLAYTPSGAPVADTADTMLPEGIELVHPRHAISWRNNWMLKQSQYVVTYITHSWGGADQFAEKAERVEKAVLKLGTNFITE
jgi:hypothetical protein